VAGSLQAAVECWAIRGDGRECGLVWEHRGVAIDVPAVRLTTFSGRSLPMSEPARRAYPYIAFDPAVRAGQPIIEGTRIPVATIVQSHQIGMDFDEILVQFPSLRPEHVHAALLYYFDHRAEVDTLIAEAEKPPPGAVAH